MNSQSNLSFLLESSGKEKYKLYISAVLSIISSILAIAPYMLMYQIILLLFTGKMETDRIMHMSIVVAGIVIMRMIIFLASGVFSHVAAFSILYELRMKAVNHLSKLHMGYFSNRTIGDVKKTVNEDIEKLESFIAHQIPDLASACVAPIVIIAYLLYLEWRLALVLFIPIILGLLFQFSMFKDMKTRMGRYHHLSQKLHSTIIQYIHGMSVMKAFNLSAKSFKQYKDTTEEYADYWEELSSISSPPYAIFLVLIDSGLLFTIPVGGYMLLGDQMNIPTYLLFLILGANFLVSFRQLLEFGMNFSMLLEGAGRVKDILEYPVQVDGKRTFDADFKGRIEFDNVTFKYEEADVLKNFSLGINPGEIVALVGPSGSGKTTVGKLIGRFWDVEQGRVLIDSYNINSYKIEELMKKVSFVFQDVFMLHDTILENVRMGLNKTEQEVEQACRKAQIHDLVMSLPDGYQTRLGEYGIKLSGGEKQRISIARALLKNSPIVVLDEVTAYSDIENESRIQLALRELLAGKTAVIIAHRLYTIKNADKIVVMDSGQVVEQGRHQELMMKDGLYRKLWDASETKTIVDERGA